MLYNVDFEICCIIFLILLLIVLPTRKRLDDFQARTFRVYLIACFANLFLDVISGYTISYYETVPVWFNYTINGLFLMTQFLVPTLFMLYIYYQVQRIEQIRRPFPWLGVSPALLGILATFISCFTGWIFYFDENGYQHGPIYLWLYINAVAYALCTIFYAIQLRKVLKEKQVILDIVLILIAICPTGLQMFFPDYLLTGLGTTLSVFLLYMTTENTVQFVDSITGVSSRDYFQMRMQENYRRGKSMKIFLIAIDNFKIINEMHGVEGGNDVLRQLGQNLSKEYDEDEVFRYGGDTFGVLLDGKREEEKELERIHGILDRWYHVSGKNVPISACICLVESGEHAKEELISALDYALREVKQLGKGKYLHIEGGLIEELERHKAIEQAMIKAINNDHFEVHYQPIYDAKKKCFHSMEALARLNVPGYGYVSPEEFIRIAEKNGTILAIGMLVLKEVCSFIKEADLKSKGIEFVEVNLSVVQCTTEGIDQDIVAVMKEYGIPAEMINLEITESAAAYSEELLKGNMASMTNAGITFSLDDYGSGYSNINYIVDLPLSIVKIDKYFLWAAMKEKASKVILEHTIQMFKEIDLKIVTEGIENNEMAQTVIDMGADYLQGYYYSKPVPKEKLLECLSEEYLKKFK